MNTRRWKPLDSSITKPSSCPQIEEIKCKRCTQINLINPNIVHSENGDPFKLYCTYCKSEIESKHERLPDKISIITNTAFLINQIFSRANTVESSSLDGLLLKWTRKQHEKS